MAEFLQSSFYPFNIVLFSFIEHFTDLSLIFIKNIISLCMFKYFFSYFSFCSLQPWNFQYFQYCM